MHFTEDYTDFGFSVGWLWGFKYRHGLGRLKIYGEGGGYDESLLPHQIEEIIAKTKNYTQRYLQLWWAWSTV